MARWRESELSRLLDEVPVLQRRHGYSLDDRELWEIMEDVLPRHRAGSIHRRYLRETDQLAYCPDHPQYRGSNPPRQDCDRCWTIFRSATEASDEEAVTREAADGDAPAGTAEWEPLQYWENDAGGRTTHWRRKDDAPSEGVFDGIIERMKRHAPAYANFRPPVHIDHLGERCALEISPFDLHLGSLAWGREAGADYDSDIARKLFLWAIQYLVERANRDPIEQIYFPIGQDFFHTDITIDGKGGATHAGTPQDVDTRWQKMFEMGFLATVEAIELAMEVAPVHVIVVPGNHDVERAWHLGKMIWAWYYNVERVTVDCEPVMRQYIQYGRNLFGFTHGKEEKMRDLPTIMATEVGNDPRVSWDETDFRELHIGHTHKKREVKFVPVDEYNGIRVRTLPSLAATESWHYEQGYVNGLRAAEAYLWSYSDGYMGHDSFNVTPEVQSAVTAS